MSSRPTKRTTVDVSTPGNSPLPPPGSGASPEGHQAPPAPRAHEPATTAPTMPAAQSNRMPQMAGATAQPYVAPKPAAVRRSHAKVYTIGAVIFLLVSVAGYIGFRSYIYGDDAPPIPVLDD